MNDPGPDDPRPTVTVLRCGECLKQRPRSNSPRLAVIPGTDTQDEIMDLLWAPTVPVGKAGKRTIERVIPASTGPWGGLGRRALTTDPCPSCGRRFTVDLATVQRATEGASPDGRRGEVDVAIGAHGLVQLLPQSASNR